MCVSFLVKFLNYLEEIPHRFCMADDGSQALYRIKDIEFLGSPRRILLQSQNGPCPLLGLANVLLLRNQLVLPDARHVSQEDLILLITAVLVEIDKKRANKEDESWRCNFNSCLNVLPTLHIGMDVNVKFKNTEAFEFTQNISIFDMLNIRLLHGWVVSKDDVVMHDLLAEESYNTVVERIFRLQDNSSEADRQEAALIKNWLEDFCSQLTYDGLAQLHTGLREREIAILFRNSHFATLFKHEKRLFVLNTDIGFLGSHLIWEQLDSVDGNTTYVGHDFRADTSKRARHVEQLRGEDVEQVVVINEAPSAPLYPRDLERGVREVGQSRMHTFGYPCLGALIIIILILSLFAYLR